MPREACGLTPLPTLPHKGGGLQGEALALIAERLEEMAAVVVRLPLPRDGKPSAQLLAWRHVAREARVPVAPGAIDRADEAMRWLMALPAEDRLIVWLRAMRVSWPRIEAIDGRCHVTLRRAWRAALAAIAADVAAGPAGAVNFGADRRAPGASAPSADRPLQGLAFSAM